MSKSGRQVTNADAGGRRAGQSNSTTSAEAFDPETEVTTIEGLAANGELHPLQRAFIDCENFQCGYCVLGQICSVGKDR